MRTIASFVMAVCCIAVGACGSPGAIPGAGIGGAGGVDAGSDGFVPPPDAGDKDALPPGAHTLTANDVSVLFPRSGASTASLLWPATLEGKGGPLLPVATYARIVRSGLIEGSTAYEKLRVVAVRFDPCFGGSACQAQVRLVLQPFEADGTVFDGAVHLLYNLTAEEFAALLGELRALSALATENKAGLPLGPSPALMAQGVNGAYGTALQALVTRYAGTDNLARMTFMFNELSATSHWQFGGMNLKFYAPKGDLAISGLPPGTLKQEVSRLLTTNEYFYRVHPEPVHLQALSAVLFSASAATVSAEARTAAYEVLVRVENPTLESPDTADCASCHLANFVRGYLDQKYPPAVPPATVYSGVAEASRFIGAAEKDADNLRAFGHFDGFEFQSPVVSQRTANETHRVLQMLSMM